MKRTLKKIFNPALENLKRHKQRIARFKFSKYQEDFVITEQEEKEGGFFGNRNLQLVKLN